MDVNMAAAPKAEGQKPKQAKKMPDNPTERHPVQLLNELRGGVTFIVVGSSGVTPNIIFTLGCEIDGTQYTGVGRNKKDAKKALRHGGLEGSLQHSVSRHSYSRGRCS